LEWFSGLGIDYHSNVLLDIIDLENICLVSKAIRKGIKTKFLGAVELQATFYFIFESRQYQILNIYNCIYLRVVKETE
jgi:hypothetical protein